MNYKEITDYEFENNRRPFMATEECVALDIIDDILQRQGLCQEWEQIDEEIQNEIFKEWARIIADNWVNHA